MPANTWKFFENNEGLHVDKIISPKDLESEGKWFVEKVTLRDGLSEGVQKVGIQNGKMFLEVLPTRGMGIWKALAGGESIGWKSPVRGPVHPKFVDLGEPSGLGWLDGFDELLCRCGLVSNGAPEFDKETGRLKYPVHGRIANRPAHAVEVRVDEGKEEIALKGVVEETRFHGVKLRMTSTITTRFNSTSFTVHDEILNFSASPADIQMLYHINFGLPLLDAGSRVVLPAKTVVPRTPRAASGLKTWDSYAAPEPAWDEMVYFLDLNADAAGWTRTLLKNAHGTRGVSLVFNTEQLPWFTLWKNTTAEADGYVTGLEPGTNFPNPRSYEKAGGFAIPVDEEFRKALEQLKVGRMPEYGFLGVAPTLLGMEQRQQGKRGARIMDVIPATPAAKAGIKGEDIITHVDGQPIADDLELIRRLSAMPAGSSVNLTVLRGSSPSQPGKTHVAKVVLSKKRVEGPRTPFAEVVDAPWRGMQVEYATAAPNFRDQSRDLDPEGSVAVIAVARDSAAWKAGLRPGDFVSHVGKSRVASPQQFYNAATPEKGPVALHLTATPSAKSLRTVPAE